MTSTLEHRLEETVRLIHKRTDLVPEVILTLGSGLGSLADEVEQKVVIPYGDIPHFLVSKVEGHAGNFVFGMLEGKRVAVMQGRFHFYEGYRQEDLVYPLRSAFKLGAKKFIVTNAAGGLHKDWNVGDLMLISDHINLLGAHPLYGENPATLGPRFYDMSQAYTPELRALAKAVAKEQGLTIREGVYCATMGPSYETPAEVRMVKGWGADAVGMSTVPEVLAAAHMKMQTLGISCITNMAAGILPEPLSHQEVIETTTRVRETFKKLIRGVLRRM